jgi:hypothetical protein
MNQEDLILQKVKELLNTDLSKLKYVEIPHVLFLISKIVYEDKKIGPKITKGVNSLLTFICFPITF